MGLLSNSKSRAKVTKLFSEYGNKLCILCYVVGLAWFLLLAYPDLNAHTYFSENALLPGLVESDFHNSEPSAEYYRDLKDEVSKRKQIPEHRLRLPVEWFVNKFNDIGLISYTQNYTFKLPHDIHKNQVFSGCNVYGILRAPKTANTEALVLSAAYKAEPYAENTLAGIALMLGLAKAFRQHTYWAKDIIFLITDDDEIGMQAWLSAYHHTYNEYIYAGELLGRSGSIQAALNLEIGTDVVSRLDVRIEGLNGQLPNLDLVNTVVRLCKREGITPTLHKRADYWSPDSVDGFLYPLKTMLLSMTQLASGCPSGNHGLFHRYNIEAITLRGVKFKAPKAISGFRDMGRVVEGIYRSLNNLLERFHQSFFFYLLPAVERYASIGLYMPPFGILALPVIIKGLSLWLSCGTKDQPEEHDSDSADNKANAEEIEMNSKMPQTENETADAKDTDKATKSKKKDMKGKDIDKNNDEKSGEDLSRTLSLAEATQSLQHLLCYIPVILMSALFGICAYLGPRYFISISNKLNIMAPTSLTVGLCALHIAAIMSPVIIQRGLRSSSFAPDVQLLKSIALLVFAVLLGATAVVNISLGFFIALLTVPILLFIKPTNIRLLQFVQACVLVLVSPVGVVCIASVIYTVIVKKALLSLESIWQNVEDGILLSAIQFEMFDNWTYGLVCLAYFPTWILFWHILWSNAVVNP